MFQPFLIVGAILVGFSAVDRHDGVRANVDAAWVGVDFQTLALD